MQTELEALLDRAGRLLERPGRSILGIAGAPASGKSTVARQLTDRLGPAARLVPMDGYHLANAVLSELGRRDRKGAVDTFDADGYAHLLRRIRQTTETVYAPRFHREIEESIAAELVVAPEVRLVITEGNYLLVPEDPWGQVRPLLDEAWYVETEEEPRLTRLVDRHVEFGKSADEAYAWAHGTDQVNARAIAATRRRADLVVRLE